MIGQFLALFIRSVTIEFETSGKFTIKFLASHFLLLVSATRERKIMFLCDETKTLNSILSSDSECPDFAKCLRGLFSSTVPLRRRSFASLVSLLLMKSEAERSCLLEIACDSNETDHVAARRRCCLSSQLVTLAFSLNGMFGLLCMRDGHSGVTCQYKAIKEWTAAE